jgi:ribonucleoside-diphosphate reductase beta chain
MSLLQASKVYKPFEYPWAYDYWKRQRLGAEALRP